METIGEKIGKLRKSKHITQEELSFQLDVSRQTIHNWEANAMQPNAENIKALCKYFGVKPDYFFVEDTPEEAEKEVVATSDINRKKNTKRIVFIFLSVVSMLAFIVSLIVTITCGCAYFTNNTGHTSSSTFEVEIYAFIIALVFSVILLLSSISFIILSIKCKENFTQM